MTQWFRVAFAAVAMCVATASPAAAQFEPVPTAPHQNVISANPFGLLFNLFNVEYERALSATSAAGIGGSTIRLNDDRYLNADVFWRYYPSATPFRGFTLGAKVGVTSVGSSTYLGYGADVNYSWLLGPRDNLYVSLGFGLKRLVGNDLDTEGYVPTVRLVNIGRAF